MWILAKIFVLLTGHDRYFPNIEWSDESWTHNVFRFYELLFGRRVGIKAEMTTTIEVDKKYRRITHVCHSWESVFALTEQYVREFLTSLKWQPIRIYIPVLQTPQGNSFFASPYIFAIGYDTSANSGAKSNVTPWSFSHTCTGSNLTITMNLRWWSNSGTQTITAKTYNAVAMTLINSVGIQSPANYKVDAYYVANPATGAHTSSVTFSAASYGVMGTTSFSGTNTASPLGASTNQQVFSNYTSLNGSITTTFARSFIIDVFGTSGGSAEPQSNSQSTNYSLGDSPACSGSSRLATTTAGVYWTAWTWTGVDQWSQIIYEIKQMDLTVDVEAGLEPQLVIK